MSHYKIEGSTVYKDPLTLWDRVHQWWHQRGIDFHSPPIGVAFPTKGRDNDGQRDPGSERTPDGGPAALPVDHAEALDILTRHAERARLR